ncbi:hypothetical protein AB1I91_26985 [Bacillus paranthracis]|uniref:hypothetical protein n=1 Tax=Bacillus paranthracis TaxID=2026186 RepID=UPI00355651AE
MKELNWTNGIEWGEIHCPMLGKYVMTYYKEGTPAYDTYTNPFVNEDGDIYIITDSTKMKAVGTRMLSG